MKKIIDLTILFMIVTILASCQNDKPKPETGFSFQTSQMAYASSFDRDPFFVKHHIKGRDVYIECIVKGASFREKDAKIIVYIDGQRKKDRTNSAFILKGLKPGEHHIQLQLKTANNSKIIKEELKVWIE